MAIPTPTSPPIPERPPQRVFADTTFLLNLASTSRPRSADFGQPVVEQLRDLQKRCDAATALLSWLQTGTEDRAIFCSPIVVQEFYWACANALLWLYNAGATTMEARSELWSKVDALVSRPECAELKKRIEQQTGRRFVSAGLVQEFLKEVIGVIGEEFRRQLVHLEIVHDGCDEPETWLAKFESLLGLGCLKASDCVIVLTARNQGADELLTDDQDFSKDGVGEYLAEHHGLKVRTQPPFKPR